LYGRAVEGDVFASPDAVSVHLKNLMQESKKQVGFILNLNHFNKGLLFVVFFHLRLKNLAN